jgi:hypothetical protein
MTPGTRLCIVSLLPDVLGTYSDGGNVAVLAQRARWRGIGVDVRTVTAEEVPPAGADLYVLGGGEDAAQRYAAEWLRKQPQLCAAIAERATTLAVCAGMQVLGSSMQDTGGRVIPGAGILPLATAPGRRRAVGEVIARCELPGVGLLTGFENHQGRTTLAPGVDALGRVLRGTGNGAGARAEGVLTRTVIGTYLHGPVLARNPALADVLLTRATGLALAPLELPDQAGVRAIRLGGGVARLRRLRGAGRPQ